MVQSIHQNNVHLMLMIFGLVVTGSISIFIFFVINGLPIFEGATEEFLLAVAMVAWVLIFPIWILLFSLFMAAVDVYWPREER